MVPRQSTLLEANSEVSSKGKDAMEDCLNKVGTGKREMG